MFHLCLIGLTNRKSRMFPVPDTDRFESCMSCGNLTSIDENFTHLPDDPRGIAATSRSRSTSAMSMPAAAPTRHHARYFESGEKTVLPSTTVTRLRGSGLFPKAPAVGFIDVIWIALFRFNVTIGVDDGVLAQHF